MLLGPFFSPPSEFTLTPVENGSCQKIGANIFVHSLDLLVYSIRLYHLSSSLFISPSFFFSVLPLLLLIRILFWAAAPTNFPSVKPCSLFSKTQVFFFLVSYTITEFGSSSIYWFIGPSVTIVLSLFMCVFFRFCITALAPILDCHNSSLPSLTHL